MNHYIFHQDLNITPSLTFDCWKQHFALASQKYGQNHDAEDYHSVFLPQNADEFHFEEYDYVVDAVDTVAAKLEIIQRAKKHHVPVISAMGAGNKLDPAGFMVSDIFKTSMDPLAKVMRRELKKRGIKHLKVVYSKEEPRKTVNDSGEETKGGRAVPGSIAFVPAVAGLVIAGEVVKDLCEK